MITFYHFYQVAIFITFYHFFQVVTFITGKRRRSFDQLQSTNLLGSFDANHKPTTLSESFVAPLVDSLASGSLLNQLNILEDELPLPGCTPRLAICLSQTLVSQFGMEEEEVKLISEEKENVDLEILQTALGRDLFESLVEWSLSGAVEKTWEAKLGKRTLPANVVKCFSKYNSCLL